MTAHLTEFFDGTDPWDGAEYELTPAEEARLCELEAVIEKGFQTFVEVGKALLEIREKKLYRTPYDTFEEYLKQRWDLKESHAYRLMDAAKVMSVLESSPIGELLPANEAQARPLTILVPEEQVEVWEEIVKEVGSGKLTARQVKNAVVEYKARKARQDANAEFHAQLDNYQSPLTTLPERYAVICADPPWRYEHSISDSRQIENQYPTMTLDEIAELPVDSIANPDCVLFLWATSPKLVEALHVMSSWGFNYRTNMVWDKEIIGMGYYARQQHEILLIGVRGEPPTPLPENRPSSVIRARRGQHSEKPQAAYSLICRMYPDAPKVELFARKVRDGWHSWGNQSGE